MMLPESVLGAQIEMSIKNTIENSVPLARTVCANPQLLKVKPSILWFLSE